MDSELRELYQQVILDHNKSPRNFKKLENANHFAEGYNPLCGDKINIYLILDGNIVKDISFQGSGCAISKASASLMSTMVKGKTLEEAEKIFEDFHHMVTGAHDDEIDLDKMGKLAVFAGVKDFPARVKCASLAWHTMISALKDEMKLFQRNNNNIQTEKMERVDKQALEADIIQTLKQCYDPEIPVDIFELGLIYEIEIDNDANVKIKMTLTSPACPVAGSLPGEVEHKIKNVPGVSDVKIELVWSPPWDKDMMSEVAKLELGFL